MAHTAGLRLAHVHFVLAWARQRRILLERFALLSHRVYWNLLRVRVEPLDLVDHVVDLNWFVRSGRTLRKVDNRRACSCHRVRSAGFIVSWTRRLFNSLFLSLTDSKRLCIITKTGVSVLDLRIVGDLLGRPLLWRGNLGCFSLWLYLRL